MQLGHLIVKIIGHINGKMSRLKKYYYKAKIRTQAKTVEGDLFVNGPSSVNSKTEFGNNVNSIGLKIWGDEKVVIGDNFYSGLGILFLTRIHNYDGGKA